MDMEILNRRPELTGYGRLVSLDGGKEMPDDLPARPANRELAVMVVSAYLRRNQVGADQIGTVISTVHAALAGLGKPADEALVERNPAVPVRRSIHRDYVICLECGSRGRVLRRHLTTAHGLTVEAYRARWNLPREHAITAPAYSERRSTLAKQLGLGRGGRGASGEASKPATPESLAAAPRRRGRPRSSAATATKPGQPGRLSGISAARAR